jgi:hypothetical protein
VTGADLELLQRMGLSVLLMVIAVALGWWFGRRK